MIQQRACPKCSLIVEGTTCPRCSEPTSREWQGYLIVLDHKCSEIAKKMGITSNGKYALKVR